VKEPISIKVFEDWTVQNMMTCIASHSHQKYPVERQVLIFRGIAVNDPNQTLVSLKITAGTTIFLALRNECNQVLSQEVRRPPPPEVSQVVPQIPLPLPKQQEIYVWCRRGEHQPLSGTDSDGNPIDHFHEIQPGKVLVCCEICKNQAVLVDQTPSDWRELLQPQMLQGFCFGCEQQQPMKFFFQCQGTLYEPRSKKCCCSDPMMVRPLLGVTRSPDIDGASSNVVHELEVNFFSCVFDYNPSVSSVRSFVLELSQRDFFLNSIAPEILGKYVFRCPCPNYCSGVMFTPTWKILGTENYSKLNDWGVRQALLQNGGLWL